MQQAVADEQPLRMVEALPWAHRLARCWSRRGPRWGRWRLWEWACARAGQDRALVATLDHGARVRVDLADPMCRFPLTYGGMHEPALTAALAAALRPGDVFLDIGANFGYYTLLAGQLVGPAGRVICFEPNPRVAANLRASLALNDCGHVRLVQAAVGRASGAQTMFVPERGQSGLGTLSAETARDLGGSMREVTVELTSLDDFAAGTDLAAVRAVKVDAEGFELEIVAGAGEMLRRYRPLLFIEVGPDTGSRLAASLRGLGYEVAHLAAGGRLVASAADYGWGNETLVGRG
jgi:FkbM family methyltransferase